MKPLYRHVPAILLIALFWVMGITASTGDSVTSDELMHITAGYSYWRTGSHRLQPENGVLPQRIAGLPLAISDHRFDFQSAAEPWRRSNVGIIGWRLFFSGGHDAKSILLHARMICGLFGVAMAATIYLWSLRLFGIAGAYVSLIVFVFCPITLSHGVYATSDAAAACFFLWCTASLIHLCRKPTALGALSLGVLLGGLALSKYSAPLFAPILLAIVLHLRPGWRITWHLSAACLTACTLIWAAYGFSFAAVGPGEAFEQGWTWVMEYPSLPLSIVQWMRRGHLLPEAWLYGMAHVLHGSRRACYLMGELSMGQWYYFPVAIAVKTPLAILALIPLALCRFTRDAAALVILWAIYLAVAMYNGPYIGIRHLLPCYAAVFILLGAAARWLVDSRARVLIVLLMAGLVAESLRARPGYLAHFNPLISTSQRFRWLADSNLDWGQDLYRLAEWIARHPDQEIYTSTFGYVFFTTDGSIKLHRLRGFPSFIQDVNTTLGPGVYCISANILLDIGMFPSVDPKFQRLCQYLKRRDPVEWVGDSIAIYHVTTDDLRSCQ